MLNPLHRKALAESLAKNISNQLKVGSHTQ
jgi:hypothetical protein